MVRTVVTHTVMSMRTSYWRIDSFLPERSDIDVHPSVVTNCIVNNFALEELGEVEQESREDEGWDVVDEVIPLWGGVLLSSVVVQWIVDRHVSLQRHDESHVDAAHQGNGVERIEEVREHQLLEWRLEAKVPQGVESHGDQVGEVEDSQNGQQFVERVPQLLAEEESDGDGVADDTKAADDHLDDTVQYEGQAK